MPEFIGSACLLASRITCYNDGYDIVRDALSVLDDYMDEMDEEEIA